MSLIWKGDFAGLPGKVVLANPMVCTNTAKGDNKLYSDARGVVPSLDLRFASQKNLNDYMTGTPLVDHQRSMSGSNLSAGTFVNSSGLIETAKVNLVSYSQEFENSYYTKANITTIQATTDVAAPDGTFTARYISGASNGRFTISSSNFTSQSGRRKSIYLRAVSGSPVVNALTQAATDPNPVTLSSTEWLRFEIDTPSSEVGGTTFVLDFRGSSTTTEVYAWGLQIEEGSAATTYIPTTNVPSAAPRFDHDPTTGESLGLLIEESRTNLIAFSATFGGWGVSSSGDGSNPTSQTVSISAPDNTTQTRELTFNRTTASTSNTSLFSKGQQLSGASVPTGSIYVKAARQSDIGKIINVYLSQTFVPVADLQEVTLTDSWQRVSSVGQNTFTTSLVVGLYSGTASTGEVKVLLWGAQLEEGSFPTSYIPTTGTALTRSADVASITGSNFSSWYNQSEGTVFGNYSSFSYGNATTPPTTAHFTDGTLNNYIRLNSGSA